MEQNVVDDPNYNSDALESVHSSDDERGKKHEQFPEFNEKTDMKNPTLTLGLVFRDHVQFKRALIMYSLVNRYGEIHFPRNEKLKVTAKCAKRCPWKCCVGKMYGSKTIQIKTILDEHTCGRTWANKNMKSHLLTDFNCQIRVESRLWKNEGYKALDRALKIIEGKHAEQYTKLWDYAEKVRNTNPGSIMKVKLDRGRFQRIYVCLGACKEGFKSGCRPLIGLDGCYLKSVHEGQLLCAVGIYPNDETWDIAYAVVEMENKSSWIWFLELLVDDVGVVNQEGWTFISDQQNGLIPAFQKVLPNSHHRFCVRHLYTNFRNLFKWKTLKDALWSVVKTTAVPHFKKVMEDMKKLDEKAYNWLMKKLAHHWSKSHFETYPKCDMLLNNLCESFNDVILVPRQKLIVIMLLLIHTLLMKRIQMRRIQW
ncbi:uncharacterized protein [Malus domestica]|uniref:uncharacterized protein n=1 Tax=Malus domestica TaxID=3750 RepID=UPI003976E5E2